MARGAVSAPPSPDVVMLYGAHAVRAALTAGRRKLLTLYATETALPRIARNSRKRRGWSRASSTRAI